MKVTYFNKKKYLSDNGIKKIIIKNYFLNLIL